MIKKYGKTAAVLCASCALAVSALPAPVQAAQEDIPGSDIEKSETVYVIMDGNGDVEKTIVSSWIHSDSGIRNVKEVLDANDVENAKTDEEPVVSGNEYTWSVSGNDVYYTYTSQAKLPVDVKITYQLDGKTIKSQDLEGKSGRLKMTVDLSSLYFEVVTVGSRQVTIHPAYLCAGTMVLDNDIFKNVTCSDSANLTTGIRACWFLQPFRA